MRNTMGRPSRGRSIRLQVSTTQDVLAWLETKGEVISDSIHRILENAMEQEREKQMETITLRQACDVLGVTMDILDQLIMNDNILVVDEGRSRRVIKASLEGVDVDLLRDPNNARNI